MNPRLQFLTHNLRQMTPVPETKKLPDGTPPDSTQDETQEDATLEFKTPAEAETIFVIRSPSEEQAAMLRKMAEENSMELEEMKVVTGSVGYSDTLGTWEKCHCKQR